MFVGFGICLVSGVGNPVFILDNLTFDLETAGVEMWHAREIIDDSRERIEKSFEACGEGDPIVRGLRIGHSNVWIHVYASVVCILLGSFLCRIRR